MVQLEITAAAWEVLPPCAREKLAADAKELLEGSDSISLLPTYLVTATHALYSGVEGSSSSAGACRP
jgi:hypothetical protein